MLSAAILIPAVLNGLLMGAIYALVALGLTLIYGVLHIINFAHGALLSAALFAAFFASSRWTRSKRNGSAWLFPNSSVSISTLPDSRR